MRIEIYRSSSKIHVITRFILVILSIASSLVLIFIDQLWKQTNQIAHSRHTSLWHPILHHSWQYQMLQTSLSLKSQTGRTQIISEKKERKKKLIMFTQSRVVHSTQRRKCQKKRQIKPTTTKLRARKRNHQTQSSISLYLILIITWSITPTSHLP